MEANDPKGVFAEAKKRMDGVIEHLRHELLGVRTGRASIGILEGVQVDAYGTRMPINQVATLSVPEPTLIVATPFDPTLMGAVEKAVRASDLGLNPSNDGKLILVPIPALTAERRKDLVKHLHGVAEEHRVSVRNVRRLSATDGRAMAFSLFSREIGASAAAARSGPCAGSPG